MSSSNPSTNRQGAPEALRRSGKSHVRWVVLVVLSLGIAFNYIDRTALSVAMPAIAEHFNLSDETQGVLLSSFYWSYVLFMIPAGWLVDKYGAKVVFGLGSLVWGGATIALGLVNSVGALFGLRWAMGASEAPSYPAASSAVRDWFPKGERSFASGTYNNGSKVGATLAVPLVAIIIAHFGWRGAFVICGALAAGFGVFWLWYYRHPEEHVKLSQSEYEHIQEEQEENTTTEKVKLTSLLGNRTVQAMCVGFFAVNFVSYFFFTWFPTYLINTFHMTILKFGFVGMLPGIAAIVGGFIGGAWSDRLYRSGKSVTFARKVPLVVGLLGSSVIALAVFTTNVWVALTLLCLANACATGAGSVLWALPTDVAPTRSTVGTIGGIQNGFANIAGIISPIVIGIIIGRTNSFVAPLLVAGAVAIIGALAYAVWLPKVEPIKIKTSLSASSPIAE
ncbi:MFS transporter [Propionimicrobium sp. PCR01-08-3]|uniref:MFS transporter n=1 Tax=Propionimicrobium sp. PCR01-08-3 TaxID=3052086 RepID=UPI00255CC0B5|nr:MFS transporter [Propionimicrobium sp. PCR01-08-3]WIY81732.1 MFS transporter [Propionimicrobium sp. PCR01-08-3]